MRVALLVSLSAVLAIAASASADTLYSTFGAGQSFDQDSGWTISAPASDAAGNYAAAADFSPSASADLGSIILGFSGITGTDLYDFALTTDNSGVPGTVLEAWNNQVPPVDFGGDSILTLTSILNPALVAGQTYWITALPGANDSWGEWNQNSSGASGVAFSNDDGSTWVPAEYGTTAPTFEVDPAASSVPAPASLPAAFVLAAGLFCLKWMRKAIA
jgi:hypothetical protein